MFGGDGETSGGCGARGRKNEILCACWLSQASRREYHSSVRFQNVLVINIY